MARRASDNLEKQASDLVECKHEFQEKLHQMQSPPPPIMRTIPSQPENDYNILDEINYVYRLIKNNGYQGDFGMEMKFGDLLPLYGEAQADKLAEILAIARKNGFINYNLKDFLHADRDEHICVRLIKTPL